MLLVCGFRRTGKDTLAKAFNGNAKFNWLVYGDRSHRSLQLVKVKRVAFADKLREEVNHLLNIKNEDFDYEKVKDNKLIGDKTYREFMIEHAKKMREEDPLYWVKRVFPPSQEIDKSETDKSETDRSETDKSQMLMITDWRYPNEFTYLWNHRRVRIYTFRVFRSDVEVPDKDKHPEERLLDRYVTNYLLVPNENDFKEACKLFPQYEGYKQSIVLDHE